jgi:hypothetical protein
MTVIGYLARTDPKFQLRCLELWLQYGSANKASKDLGISHNTVRYHAWRYILYHPIECRKYIDNLSEEDTRYYRKMTDQEYFALLTRKAIKYLSNIAFNQFVIDNEIWKYPEVYETFKYRFVEIYKRHLDKIQA